jgi:hypothetical protein
MSQSPSISYRDAVNTFKMKPLLPFLLLQISYESEIPAVMAENLVVFRVLE